VSELSDRRALWNGCRFKADSTKGHYESFFQRANHPTRPLAFWIRYTIFSPRRDPAAAMGELWAVYSDGEQGRITAVKEEIAISECRFSDSKLDIRIAESILTEDRCQGSAASSGHELRWDLTTSGGGEPLFLLPRSFYERGLPKAKVLVAAPNAVYQGAMLVDGERIVIDGWVGSQNHNWGSQHTDHYAWGQVAGFDEAPEAFLECGTSRIRIGPVWTPWMTVVVLRLEGREFALNSLGQALRARGRFDYFNWTFESRARDVRIQGRIQAPASAFVGLCYRNPPGGTKTCLNCKIASCEVVIEPRAGAPRILRTANRAAFEILTDSQDHGVAVRA
jgi:hypothetical protein